MVLSTSASDWLQILIMLLGTLNPSHLLTYSLTPIIIIISVSYIVK